MPRASSSALSMPVRSRASSAAWAPASGSSCSDASADAFLLESEIEAGGDREALLVEQLLDAADQGEVLLAEDALSGLALARLQDGELGLPVAQHVGLDV